LIADIDDQPAMTSETGLPKFGAQKLVEEEKVPDTSNLDHTKPS